MKDRLSPGPPARGGRAAVVEAHHDVAVLSQHLGARAGCRRPSDRARSGRPARRRRGPAADTSRSGRSPAETCTSRRGRYRRRCRRGRTRSSPSRAQRAFPASALFSASSADPSRGWASGQGRRVGGSCRRPKTGGLPIARPARVRSRACPDWSAGVTRSRPGAVELNAKEVPLSRVVGRGDEVDPVRLLVDREKLDHVEIAGRDQRRVLPPVRADPVEMPPAVALAEPEELLLACESSGARPGDRPRRRRAPSRSSAITRPIDREHEGRTSMTRTVF